MALPDKNDKPKVSVIWFKRDLRVHDHEPLMRALAANHAIIPLYVIEPDLWQQPTSARRHWHFIHDCLVDLRAQFSKWNHPFYIRIGCITDSLKALRQTYQIDGVYAHQETGNQWSFARDKHVHAFCQSAKIPLIELPNAGVARAFGNRDKWASLRAKRMAEDRLIPPTHLPTPLPAHIAPHCAFLSDEGQLPDKNNPLFGAPIIRGDQTQTGGRAQAIALLTSFLTKRKSGYIRQLASPSRASESCLRLSPHLAYGTISSREVVQTIQNYLSDPHNHCTAYDKRIGRAVLSRLAWRCHFMQKLEDEPAIEKQAMHPFYETVRADSYRDSYYQAWAQGQTGYPLIDACMRSLLQTGWLPFRMRAMLVSFASYHLWLDWRDTAPHLARLFTDYEPGIHYSQFQMQSGVTGINTIRIYNPLKQSDDHDKDGKFIKKWCPELQNLPSNYIAAPHLMPPAEALMIGFQIGKDYPLPIVDNEAAMRLARDKIFTIRSQDDFAHHARAVFQKLGSRNRPTTRRPRKKAAKADASQLSLF